MLTITQAQWKAFSRDAKRRFEHRLLLQLHALFPQAASALGESLPALIADGIDRAQQLGFESERNVTRFLNLVMEFGPQFHKPGRFPWVDKVLRDPMLNDPTARMDALMDLALVEADKSRPAVPWYEERR